MSYLFIAAPNRNPALKNNHLRSVKYTATFMQKLSVIMADEKNNNGDGVLISKPTGHHNQLYVLIFTSNMSSKL